MRIVELRVQIVFYKEKNFKDLLKSDPKTIRWYEHVWNGKGGGEEEEEEEEEEGVGGTVFMMETNRSKEGMCCKLNITKVHPNMNPPPVPGGCGAPKVYCCPPCAICGAIAAVSSSSKLK